MKVHLINPSSVSFGTAVITPRWQYVLAGATPRSFGDPILVDETLFQMDPERIQPGDAVGIGIHTANALRGYEIGKLARERGAYVIFGGIHATLYPEEARELGGAHAVVKGDGDIVWAKALADCRDGVPKPIYAGGQIEASDFVQARWDLVPRNRYMWASVQTVRGCPKHCSFCSVWRTDGQRPRQRTSDVVIEEIVQLRRLGFRFVALADDNFYPVTLTDLNLATQQKNTTRLNELKSLRAERFELMARLAQLPEDMVFFTQITMEAAEDIEFLNAMKAARIKGALVGVESVCRCEKRRCHLRAIRHLEPLSRDGGLQSLGKRARTESTNHRGSSSHPALADSASASPEAVLGPSGNVRRGNPFANSGSMGQLLQSRFHLEAFEFYQVKPWPAGVCSHFENLSPDVRRYRHRHR